MRLFLLTLLVWASPAVAQQQSRAIDSPEPPLQIQKFGMPLIDYRAPDGTWKRGNGIIVGRDVAPNTTVGVGFFRMKPKSPDGPETPFAAKSKKVAVGFTLKF